MALVPSSFLVTTSKALVTSSVALVTAVLSNEKQLSISLSISLRVSVLFHSFTCFWASQLLGFLLQLHCLRFRVLKKQGSARQNIHLIETQTAAQFPQTLSVSWISCCTCFIFAARSAWGSRNGEILDASRIQQT